MKKLIAIVLLFGAVSVKAEPIGMIDADHPLLNARVGIAWDHTGRQYSVAQVPMLMLVGKTSKNEYGSLSIGAVNKMADGKVGYVLGLGLRLDSIFLKFGQSNFAQKYLLFSKLPPVQISTILATQDFKKYIPMLAVSTKFGR